MFNHNLLKFTLASLVIGMTGSAQVALADRAACMPLKYQQVEDEEDGTIVFTAVPLFPNAVPPKPQPTFPLNPLVVEGNDGQFVPIGSNATHLEPARFQWNVNNQVAGPRMILQLPFGPVFRLGFTTHYEICVFQENEEKNCDDAIPTSPDQTRRGIVKFVADCAAESHRPNGMRGISPSNGGTPRFIPAYDQNGIQVLEIFWKMRACNGTKCSDWTDKSLHFWVPPPELRDPEFTETQNSRLTTPNNPVSDFPVTFIWEPAAGMRTGARYIPPTARLCIASPGERCSSGGSNNPSAFDDPWVAFVNVPNSIGVAISKSVNYFDSQNQIFNFAGETVHWTAANCWQMPSGRVICVYNNKVGSVTFLP